MQPVEGIRIRNGCHYFVRKPEPAEVFVMCCTRAKYVPPRSTYVCVHCQYYSGAHSGSNFFGDAYEGKNQSYASGRMLPVNINASVDSKKEVQD
jgi:hypothetical protein